MNKLLIVGTVPFDAIETPFGKTDIFHCDNK